MMILEVQLVDFHSTWDHIIIKKMIFFLRKGFNFFFLMFQPIAFAPDNSSLLSDQESIFCVDGD